ncbi:unnamed protein product [Mycena citricolor]|uniref:RRM domain-containing protein n=1 Tax=Mycena citricolor TaxID=2018698 RepID=A0AAD2K6W9_9AGAR|nr:unnamed protein product [Mycena citricolor]
MSSPSATTTIITPTPAPASTAAAAIPSLTPATTSTTGHAPPTPPPEASSHPTSPNSNKGASATPAADVALPVSPPSSTLVSAASSPAPTSPTSPTSPVSAQLTGSPPIGPPESAYSLPTSVSSPAWFPATQDQETGLAPSASAATLVGSPVPGNPAEVFKAKVREAARLMEGQGKTLVVADDGACEGDEEEDGEVTQIIIQAQPPHAPASRTIPLPVVVDQQPLRGDRSREPSFASSTLLPASMRSQQAHRPLPPSQSHTIHSSPQAHAHSDHESLPDHRTPNVYINGLPPNFPEDQLFALAAPFGTVKSVRCFTRHVSETETGYGFVLFEEVAAAARCIEVLRKYRNLHPTFSKQVHKIPGTVYATVSSHHGDEHSQNDQSLHTGGSVGASSEWDDVSATDSFKAKMERLADRTSTNLYIEGLPLSIDDATLAALVSPYAIRSSRFFQTKLSHPPRIIAFVRLETRTAAEEIIERLHGRMVRGWNDAGSRISVRFADTSEQRELRRQERTARDEDHGQAGQLSIAQATLLNLRGKELAAAQSHAHSFHPTSTSASSLYPHSHSQHHHHHHQPPHQQHPSSVFAKHGLQQPLYSTPGLREFHPDRYDPHTGMYGEDEEDHAGAFEVDYSLAPGNNRLDPAMQNLLETLQAQAQIRSRARSLSQAQASSHMQPMQQQQQQPKRRPVPLDLDSSGVGLGVGMRGYRVPAATVTYGGAGGGMDEEMFHQQHQSQHPQPRRMPKGPGEAFARSAYQRQQHQHSLSHEHHLQQQQQHQQAQPAQHSPPLVSPALTYTSSRSSVAAFSPTTPQFGFPSEAEQVKGVAPGAGAVGKQRRSHHHHHQSQGQGQFGTTGPASGVRTTTR